jgi:hypothetical protein
LTSRLRRMLLVNTRTSGNATSASINQIDPRDGASITGENAVGKTTTLELFPLFFGTLPSQITETVGGREPMLKFVLPMPYSAIVFEYQRGNDEAHDMRCAVLRRGDNDHRPVYRFINRGFREEAFLRTNEEGQQIFCDDGQMRDAYIAMGAQCSKLLDISEYRAVILGAEARTQDAKELRRLSTVYGFGSRLTNLDRLIAAVAKEKLDFKDFVRLAITIVQERLSTHGDVPSRQKITLRQSKDQIANWLRDRSALEKAFGMEKDVGLLREALEQLSNAEASLRAVRQEVAPALKSRREKLLVTTDALKAARGTLNEHNTRSQRTTETLLAVVEQSSSAHNDAHNKVRAEEARRASLHLSEVKDWANALERVEQKQVELRHLEASADEMSGKSSNIERRFADLIGEANDAARDAAAKIRASKEDVRSRTDAEADGLRKAAADQQAALTAELSAIEGELKPRIEELVDERAQLQAQVAAAQPSREASQELMTAQDAQINASQRLVDVGRSREAANTAWESARREHQDAERLVDDTQQRLNEAAARVTQAQARLTPADGTLLSVLRASPDDSWKRGLAKILDPALLSRSDLSPMHNPGADQEVAFGWQLNTTPLSQPEWSDDELLREALAHAEGVHSAAKTRLAEAKQALNAATQTLDARKKSRSEAEGEVAVAQTYLEKAKREAKEASDRCDQEVAEIKRNGATRVKDVGDKLTELRLQLERAQTKERADREQVGKDLDVQLAQLRARTTQSIDAIEGRALEALATGKANATALQVQRDAALKAEGVDPVVLAARRSEAKTLKEEIHRILERGPAVELWRQWLNEGGDQILVNLGTAATKTEGARTKAQADLSAHETKAKQEGAALAAEVGRMESLESLLNDDIRALVAILEELGLSESTSREPEPNLSLDELRSRLNRARAHVDDSENVVRRRHSPIRDQLIGQASSVAEYIQQSLDALPAEMTPMGRAAELCTIYAGLRRQVLPNVINDVTTILNQVRQFRGVITRFEGEVRNFNREFQRGLNVAQFHRIESLKVEIVSNFGEISFMREIDAIDRVAREHETSLAVNDRSQLPSADTAAALTKFLQLLRQDSTVELDLAAHVDLKGSVTVNGQTRHFSRPADLEHISSTGINAIILISLLVGMLNMIRGDNDIYIPWISDEVGKFDPGNFKGLMDTLRENRIDPVTASPTLTHAEFRHFARRYVFKDRGSIGLFSPAVRPARKAAAATSEAGHEA